MPLGYGFLSVIILILLRNPFRCRDGLDLKSFITTGPKNGILRDRF